MPNSAQEAAGVAAAHPDPSNLEDRIRRDGYRMPVVSVKDGWWTVQFVTGAENPRLGNYSGSGADFPTAYAAAVAAGPELDVEAEDVDVAARLANIV